MVRNLVVFFAALLLSLTAGRAFWVTLGENPFNMSGPTYVEFFQQLDKRIVLPIAITGMGGTLLAGLAALLYKSERKAFYLLLAACGLAVVGDLVTILINIPINNRLATWNPAALPPGYEAFLQRWWQWHQVRLVAMFAAMGLVFAAMLVRRHVPEHRS
ncbi:MAG TPA: DUF1772 domain-containing protein [Chthoniobacterales bacterium]|jgi:uncharacterized membrane protein|nr:DUF1772 domain-containing protein [Chthoniobacterales bacterium]